MHCYCNVLINKPKLCTCDMPLNTCTGILIMSLSGAKKKYPDQISNELKLLLKMCTLILLGKIIS